MHLPHQHEKQQHSSQQPLQQQQQQQQRTFPSPDVPLSTAPTAEMEGNSTQPFATNVSFTPLATHQQLPITAASTPQQRPSPGPSTTNSTSAPGSVTSSSLTVNPSDTSPHPTSLLSQSSTSTSAAITTTTTTTDAAAAKIAAENAAAVAAAVAATAATSASTNHSQPLIMPSVPTIDGGIRVDRAPVSALSTTAAATTTATTTNHVTTEMVIPNQSAFATIEGRPHESSAAMIVDNGQGQGSSSTKKYQEKPILTNGNLFGHRLSDFHLVKTLGTGTFGRVYLSRYRDTSQYYAMKVLPKSEIVRLKQVEHINSEKNILAIIDFPFVVNMICTFQDNRNIYMLLEYVIGGELFSHLRRAGRFTNDITRFYAAEIVLAIEYLHNLNIIYRDLKPENLLLDERGHIKITDFGFAKLVTDRTWTLCGTPEYLAPEIIQSKGHGKAVDWWALGILIYEMLAGYPPFFDENPFGIYEKILANKVVYPSHFYPDAKDIIRRLLNADRTRRLGNLSGGAQDVKSHKWFQGVDWNILLAKAVRAPNIPEARFAGDTRNFENYPEIQQQPDATDDPHAHLFQTF